MSCVTCVVHLFDDLGAFRVSLADQFINRVDDLMNHHSVRGNRYNAQLNFEVDIKSFETLISRWDQRHFPTNLHAFA